MAKWTRGMWLVALTACQETGTFDYVEPGADVGDSTVDTAGPSDPGLQQPGDDPSKPGDGPSDDPPRPTSFQHCGPDLRPSGPDATVVVGELALSQDGFRGPLVWEGCEVVRQFDARGRFVCETSWTVEGNGEVRRDEPAFLYQVAFTPDPEHSNCDDPPERFEELRGYDLGLDGRNPTITLFLPVGDDAWEDKGTFPLGGGLQTQRASYGWER